jgi:pimeloyl-ACP methyl ester carboxylesterase
VRRAELPDGTAVWTDEGSGPAVFAVHGMPGSRFDFRWLAPALAGFRVVRAEQPGFGAAPVAGVAPHAAAIAAHLVAVMDAAGVDRAILLAHSFGAGVSAHLAEALGERARGMALLAPAGLRPHSHLKHRRTLRAIGAGARTPALGWAVGHALIPPYRAVGFKRATAAEARRTFAVVGGWDWAGTRAAATRLRERGLPTLVALAADDPIVEVPRARLWAEHLGVDPIVYETGGHNLQKTRAVEFADALRAWHADLPAG